MTCSFTNYQLHLEKYHSFDVMKKANLCSNITKNFDDLYDLQSTSYNSLQQDYTKDVSNDVYNNDSIYDVNSLGNETENIDLPPNQSNLDMCMNLINNSFDQMGNYLDNVDGSMTYSDNSSFKYSEMLQNPQNNTTGLENNIATADAFEGINLENSFMENNMCDSGSNLDEMLDFLGNNTSLTETSQPQSLGANTSVTVSTPVKSVQSVPNQPPLINYSKFKKVFYCKLCLNKKLRRYSSRAALLKHSKATHPNAHRNEYLGHLVDGQIPGFNSPNHAPVNTQDGRTVFHQYSRERTAEVETKAAGVNDFQLNKDIMRYNSFNNNSRERTAEVETKAADVNDDFQLNKDIMRYNSPNNNSNNLIQPNGPIEEQLDAKYASPERKTKYPQVKCKYCGKMLTTIYVKQHIARKHPNASMSDLSSNYVDSVPSEFKRSLPVTSDLAQENADSNTCLSVSDALKTDEKCELFLNVSQRPNDCFSSSLAPSRKFVPNNEKHLEQGLDKNNFTNNSTHIFYTCHLCQRRYTSQSFLSKHIKTYHGFDDMNAPARCDLSYNEISDSSKFSDTNNSEINQPLTDMPFENDPNSFGNYNYVENNQLNASILQGDNLDVNDRARTLENYNSNLPDSELFTSQPEISNVKNFAQSEILKQDICNLSKTAEFKEEYSDPLHTTEGKIYQNAQLSLHSRNTSLELEQNSSASENILVSKDLPEANVNYHKLPRFKCRICLNTYSGKAYFKKHYKSKHNRLISDKELEALQVFNDPVKSRVKKEKKAEPLNPYSRRLSLEASKSNYSDINDLLSAQARSNEKVTCKICNKLYSCRGNLRIHMKNVHNYRGMMQRSVDGRKKEVQCHICLKLLQNTSLKAHVQAVHGDAFLTDEQEAYTVSNVAALSAVNYCAENVEHTLPDLISSKVIGLDSNNSKKLVSTPKEPISLNQKENGSSFNYLNNLDASQHSNDLHENVIGVSSRKTSNESTNDVKAICDLDLRSELNNQNMPINQSDLDEEFSLSDIPTSDDECANFMNTVMLPEDLMENSKWTKDESFLSGDGQNITSVESNNSLEHLSNVAETDNYCNSECMADNNIDKSLDNQLKTSSPKKSMSSQNITSVESNHSLEQSSDVTGTDENCNSECMADNCIEESLDNQSKAPSTSEKDVNSYPNGNSVSELAESCENLGEVDLSSSTSVPETPTEFHIGVDKDFAQKLDSEFEAEINSLCPIEDYRPDQSSTDDELNVSLETVSSVDSPEKIGINRFSLQSQESKTNVCRLCHKKFTTMKLLSKHLKIYHNIPFLKKQNSAKRKPDQDEKLSPPLLTQHQTNASNTLPPALETSQNCIEKSVIENMNKFVGSSNEVSKCNGDHSVAESCINRVSSSTERTNLHDSTDAELPCEIERNVPPSLSVTTNIVKDINTDNKFEPQKKRKLSAPDDIEMPYDTNSDKLISVNKILLHDRYNNVDSGNAGLASLPVSDDSDVLHPISNDSESVHISHLVSDDQEISNASHSVYHKNENTFHPVSDNCENERLLSPISGDHENQNASQPVSDENENASLPVSDDHENEHQDKISKAPILPCIIKVLKNEQNAIIYQIDKSKSDDSSSNSVDRESKSSSSPNRFSMNRNSRKSHNSRNYRKKINRSPYRSTLYSRQRSLMRRKSRTLFSKRNKILKRPRRKRTKPKPAIRTFKYPNDVNAFLEHNKQPVVLLTRLDKETLSKYNYNACALRSDNEKQVIVRLEKCDVSNIQHPTHCADITDLSFSNEESAQKDTHLDDSDNPINPVMKFQQNSAIQEATNVAVVLKRLKFNADSSVVPLNDDIEVSTYTNSVQYPALKECRVLLTRIKS